MSSALGFVVGFAMFGAITFLPLYLQVVKGVNPTVSGLQLMPMMVGLLLTSVGSGQIISRTGRYKVFPIIGTALITIGLVLLSRLGPRHQLADASLSMFVFGAGLGSVMQVPVLAVQNAVDYKDLGAATSGVTYFRQIGGSFGAAVFGSIFSNRLEANIAHYLGGVALPGGVSSETLSPDALSKLSPAAHSAFIHAYADSLETVFLAAVPVAAVAFLISWLPPQVPLRKTVAASDPGQTFGMPTDRSSAQELERGLGVLAGREDRVALYRRIAAQAGLSGLRPAASCLLARIADHRGVTRADLAEQIGTSTAHLAPSLDQLASRELVTIEPSSHVLNLTPNGRSALERLRRAREDGLRELLDDWSPEQEAELDVLLDNRMDQLVADQEVEPGRLGRCTHADQLETPSVRQLD